MKKKILKVFGVVFIIGLMVFNMQFLNTQGGSSLSLDGLINMAYAQTEGGSGGESGGSNCPNGTTKYNCVRTSNTSGRFTSTACGQTGCPTVNYDTIEVTGECTACNI